MVLIQLSPKPGFCIKSTTLSPGIIHPPKVDKNPYFLEPQPAAIPIPPNRKVFVNIAWDSNVPPPPEGSEEVIQKAMHGHDEIDESNNPQGWFVPVIVSNPREDKDKAGNPSIIFDCIYNNTSVKARSLRDPEFKVFLVELSLQRIEAQTGLYLSRSIGTPNITSKGKLLPRKVQIPASMLPASRSISEEDGVRNVVVSTPTTAQINGNKSRSPLIQEISSTQTITSAPKSNKDSLPGLRGILKSSSSTTNSPSTTSTRVKKPANRNEPLFWTWSKVDNHNGSSSRLKIEVHVPDTTIPTINSAELHVSERSLELMVPNHTPLLIDLSLSDAEIAARVAASHSTTSPHASASDEEAQKRKSRQHEETASVLQLKRQRDFDVDGAEAEWKVGTGVVEIFL